MSDTKIGIYEAKTQLPKLVADAQNGKSFTITRHGKPVARIVPLDNENDFLQDKKRQAAINELRTFRKGRSLGDISIRELIEEGRKY